MLHASVLKKGNEYTFEVDHAEETLFPLAVERGAQKSAQPFQGFIIYTFVVVAFSVMFPYSHSFVVVKRKPETRKNLHLKAPSSFGATVRRAPCIAQKG